MNPKLNYNGLDWLKFLAALLVVANHTSPMLSFSDRADFLFSGLLTRIAVPIFFMTSGYFYFRKLTGDPARDKTAMYGYLKKIGRLYGIAILIYIPINLYTGYFTNDFTVYSFLRDIVFNGTLYHLWYLPALMIGIVITTYMYKKMSLNMMLAGAGILYLIGLLGDSYYGMMEGSVVLTHLYDGMFKVFDYTRNGLFYAPIYLVLGAWAAKRPIPQRSSAVNASLFFISLGLMFAEGLLLKAAGFPRHDSMYIFALPAAYFLFYWALQWRGKSGKAFREWRVWIYILHPLAIVLIRGAAKAVHLEHWFIENSLIHYIAVCLVSIVMAAVAVQISIRKWKVKREPMNGSVSH